MMGTTVVLLIGLGIVFLGGIWVARHHRAQIDARLDEIHGTIKSTRQEVLAKIQQIKGMVK